MGFGGGETAPELLFLSFCWLTRQPGVRGPQAPALFLFVARFCQQSWQKRATKRMFLEGFALQTSLLGVYQQYHQHWSRETCPTQLLRLIHQAMNSSSTRRRFARSSPMCAAR